MPVPDVNDDTSIDEEQTTESSVNDNIEGIKGMNHRITVVNNVGVADSVNYLPIVTYRSD